MLVLSVVLIVTNVATLAALWRLWRQDNPLHPGDGELLGAVAAQRPAGVTGRTRRFISVEILNPIELAGKRSRMVGIAGSIAPGLTRRIVYEQALKTLRRQLHDQHVVADVRLHTLRPTTPEPVGAQPYDEVEILDMDEAASAQPPVV